MIKNETYDRINQLQVIPFFSGLIVDHKTNDNRIVWKEKINHRLDELSYQSNIICTNDDVISTRFIADDILSILYTNGCGIFIVADIGKGIPHFSSSSFSCYKNDIMNNLTLANKDDFMNCHEIIQMNYQKKLAQDLIMLYKDHPIVSKLVTILDKHVHDCQTISEKFFNKKKTFIPQWYYFDGLHKQITFIHTIYLSSNSTLNDNEVDFLINSKKLGSVLFKDTWLMLEKEIKSHKSAGNFENQLRFQDIHQTTVFCNWGRTLITSDQSFHGLSQILNDSVLCKIINNIASIKSKIYLADIDLKTVKFPVDKPNQIQEYYNLLNIEYIRARNNSYANTEITEKHLMKILLNTSELENKYQLLMSEVNLRLNNADYIQKLKQNHSTVLQNIFLAIFTSVSSYMTIKEFVTNPVTNPIQYVVLGSILLVSIILTIKVSKL